MFASMSGQSASFHYVELSAGHGALSSLDLDESCMVYPSLTEPLASFCNYMPREFVHRSSHEIALASDLGALYHVKFDGDNLREQWMVESYQRAKLNTK